jgi:hypothetical protein
MSVIARHGIPLIFQKHNGPVCCRA